MGGGGRTGKTTAAQVMNGLVSRGPPLLGVHPTPGTAAPCKPVTERPDGVRSAGGLGLGMTDTPDLGAGGVVSKGTGE